VYSNLYNFAPAGYCTLNQKGRILNCNQTLADLLEVDREQLLQQLLSDFVAPDDQDEYYLHRRRALKDRQRQVSEIRVVKQGGAEMVVRMESVPAREEATQLMVMLSDVTEQHRLIARQEEFIAKVELQKQLIERSEIERMELARNLHDGPLQSLTSLGFSVQIIKEMLKEHGVDGDENLHQMAEDIKNLSAELRGICNDLRPPVLSRFGLRRALQENAAEFKLKHPQTNITLAFPDDPTLLPEPITLALYRIYQQALSNILRHTTANEVHVRIAFNPDQVLFEIEDNGQGFSGPVDLVDYLRQGHLGLVGMRERAEAVGGSMELISRAGEGATVRVLVPWPRNG
jgi:PAS domain S-box-containing protein